MTRLRRQLARRGVERALDSPAFGLGAALLVLLGIVAVFGVLPTGLGLGLLALLVVD